MSDLVGFLRARLDDDEQAARAAANHTGRWRWEHDTGDMCNDPECPYGELVDEARPDETVSGTVLMQVHGYDVKEPWSGGPHIARHDPARVLAEIEAKRRIIEAHHSIDDRGEPICAECSHAPGEYYTVGHPCPTLRLLAVPYEGHPDYQESWRP